MKNIILFIVVIILSFVCLSSFNKETTFFNNEKEVEEVKVVIKDSSTGDTENIFLEDYIVGVVAGEMPASFCDEALKAQAIAARSYAVYKMNTTNASYDLVTDVTNQVYINMDTMKGIWKDNFEYYYNKVKSAVLDTKDLVMTYNGEVICSFYFSSSNGLTEDASLVFGEEKDYLKSVSSPDFSAEVETTLSKDEFCLKLGISCDEIFLSNIEKSSSGRINYITINGKKFKGVFVRSRLNLRSTDFNIKLQGDSVLISTRGYGHGVGMSQYGANAMAKSGKTYEEILKHYYQNINIEKNNV